MKKFKETIWKDGEYNYEAAYGFVPNIHGYIHDEDDVNRDCILVVPGGGYCLCAPHEGEMIAEVFYNKGLNAFVLTYTTDITMSVPLKKQPLEDISRGVRFIRKHGAEYNIEEKRLIVCGFSAGAHVVGSLAVHFADINDKSEEYAKISNRPDGAILSYPVITSGEYTHKYSMQTLLGSEPSEEELTYFSLEKQVSENTPPCFIWQTATDNAVPVENSYLMAEALRAKGIMFSHHVFPTGFHGISYPSDKFFSANAGGEYVMEQVERAVAAVKSGKGVNVSDQRRKELEEQFPDKKPDDQENTSSDENLPPMDMTWSQDIGLWPDLAYAWMNRI
ncbi:MAG: alpha/beta hydrolase [Eubacterium sp.]|nr:alpha/beta hydrolase [Eubacterium sp.]